MPKYLVLGSYTDEGWKGVQKEGGTERGKALDEHARSVGGNIEAYYFCLGEYDYVVISDYPDNVTVMSGMAMAQASGTVNAKVIPLLTLEEMDQVASENQGKFRPSGQ